MTNASTIASLLEARLNLEHGENGMESRAPKKVFHKEWNQFISCAVIEIIAAHVQVLLYTKKKKQKKTSANQQIVLIKQFYTSENYKL